MDIFNFRVEQKKTMKSPLTVEDISKKSIPGLLLERNKLSPEEVAFCYKDFGVYQEVTWGEYWRHVEDFALGLMELGLKIGDHVAIMADPCPEWFYSDLAVLCTRAIDFGVYTTSSMDEIEYLMQIGEAKFFIAENQEYVDKILPIIDRLPKLKKVIVIDTRATFMYDERILISFAEVEGIGRSRKEKFPKELNKRIEQVDPYEPAFMIFTSGTAGPPKPAVLTQHNILAGLVLASGEVFPTIRTHEHRMVSHLSMAHVIERGFSLYCPLVYKVIPHIGESLQYMQETLYEIQPTFFHGVPRIWEKIAAQVMVGIESSSRIKKISYQLAMSLRERYMQMIWKSEKPSWAWRILNWISFQIAFRHILHRVGMCKVKYAFSAGAPLPSAIQKLWQTWGVDLINLYGATEAGGTICSQRPGFPRPGTLGKPTSLNKVSLGEDGEVLVSGPGVFKCYWKNEEVTKEALKEGWLCTGDVGRWTEDGDLCIIDRKKDIMITSGGKNITPSLIETALKASPYISEAVIIADGRKFPSALIEIDFETVSEWARKNKILYTGFTSLAMHPETNRLIGEEVEKTNQLFSRVEQVKKFRIMPKELDPEEGDTTATRKIKRKTMYKLFHNLIEEMYMDEEKLFKSQLAENNSG